jgi:hypothetical protein
MSPMSLLLAPQTGDVLCNIRLVIEERRTTQGYRTEGCPLCTRLPPCAPPTVIPSPLNRCLFRSVPLCAVLCCAVLCCAALQCTPVPRSSTLPCGAGVRPLTASRSTSAQPWQHTKHTRSSSRPSNANSSSSSHKVPSSSHTATASSNSSNLGPPTAAAVH